MKTRRSSWVAGIGIAVGILGIITPIVWDCLKSSVALELQLLAATHVIDPSSDAILPEVLEVSLGGEPIDNISQLTFALLNAGEVPIRQEDVVKPVNICFSGGGRVVGFQAIEMGPT